MKTERIEPRSLEDVAVEWAVRQAAGLTPAEEARLEKWLSDDPQHYAAFAEADLALSVFTPPPDRRDREDLRKHLADWEEKKRARKKRIAFIAAGLGMAAAAAALVALLPVPWPQRSTPAPAAIVTVRPLLQSLSDGSIVELNGDAEVTVEFTPETRAIRLVRGEAHFAVAKDPIRPFVVSVGPVRVRAVGTKFDVNFRSDEVDVLVTEGKVRVTENSASIRPQPASMHVSSPMSAPASRETDLGAGTKTAISLSPNASKAPVVTPVAPDEVQRTLAWRQLRFEISNATLEEAVTLFNRTGRGHVVIGDSTLRGRRISGIYWADSPTQFAELIASTLDIKAVSDGTDRIVLRKP